MEPLTAFFLIILIGLFSSTLFRKFHFPWVVALVVGGIIIGPDVLNIYKPDTTTDFLGNLGLTFLMFMAGLETNIHKLQRSGKEAFILPLINGFIPFLVGLGIGYYLGLKPITIFMIGVVFVSSSIAVIIPTLEINDLLDHRIGSLVMIKSILEDMTSLLLLSILLQNINPATNIPLYIFYPLLLIIVVLMRILIPRVKDLLSSVTSSEDLFQYELRSVFFILIGTIIVFELLGLHSIIGGFFAGLVLSDSVTDKVLMGKIRAISYGVFIPVFFVLVGTNTNIKVLFSLGDAWLYTLLIVFGSMLSKFFSGFFGSKLIGFNTHQASFIGVSAIPQLSTTLAATYTAYSYGVISDELNTAFVALSIVTTLIGPLLMSEFDPDRLAEDQV